MEVKKKKMEAKKGEGKGRRQKAIIGIFVAAVVIAALFTVTIGIGMNNSDTGNSIVGESDIEDSIVALGGSGEAISSRDVRISGIFERGPNVINVHGSQVIYEGTSCFIITIENTGKESFSIYYSVDGKRKTSRTLPINSSMTLSYGYGNGELKRVEVDSSYPCAGQYWIS